MFNFSSFVVAAASTSSAAAGTGNDAMTMLVSFGPFIVLIALLWFIMIRPQKKKEKQTQKMREAVQTGDNVITVSGVIGRVVSVKDDSVIIETGADRSKIQIKKWAIQSVETLHEGD